VRDLLSLSAAAGNAVASGFIAGQQGGIIANILE